MLSKIGIAVAGICLLIGCGGGGGAADAGVYPNPLDPSFGLDGSTLVPFSCGDGDSAALVKVTGGFVAGGGGCKGWALAGYTATGQLDATFGDAGTAFHFSGEGSFSAVTSLVARKDGRLLAIGRRTSDSSLVQLSATGAIDPAFSAAISADFAMYFRSNLAMALQPDDKLVVAGGDTVIRITTTGARDATFGTAGASFLSLFGINTQIRQVLIEADGRIVLVGMNTEGSQREVFVAQLTSKGALETSFGTNGIFKLPAAFGGEAAVAAAAVQADGKIVLAGSEFGSGSPYSHPTLWRITSTGALDTTFADMGRAAGVRGIGNGHFTAVSVLTSGAIVAAGDTDTEKTFKSWQVARFTSAGAFDTTFGVGGTTVFQVEIAANLGGATSMVATDEGYVVAGRAHKRGTDRYESPIFGIARVRP